MKSFGLHVSAALVCGAMVVSFGSVRGQGLAANGGKPGPLLLVCNQHDRTLSFVDPEAEKRVFTLPENEVTAHEVAVSPDGRTAYLPIYGDGGVGRAGTDGAVMLVVDVPGRRVRGRVDFGHAVRPHMPVYNRADGMLYVTTELDKTVTVIDPKTLKIVGSVPTGEEQSHMLAISPDGRRGYTANVSTGTVSVLDLKSRRLVKVIPVAKRVQRIYATRDGRYVITSDTTKPEMDVLDTATNEVIRRISVPAPGYGVAETMDGRWLVVAAHFDPKIAVIDLKALKLARVIDVPHQTEGVLMRPDGKFAYVASTSGNGVYPLDLETWKVGPIILTGNYADGMAWVPGR